MVLLDVKKYDLHPIFHSLSVKSKSAQHGSNHRNESSWFFIMNSSKITKDKSYSSSSCSPCVHLFLHCAPPLRHLTGSLLVTIQLGASVRVELAELRARLCGPSDLWLQRLEDPLLLSNLSPPLLERDEKKNEMRHDFTVLQCDLLLF